MTFFGKQKYLFYKILGNHMVLRTGCLADTKNFVEKFNAARTRNAKATVIAEYEEIYRRRQRESNKCPGLGLAISKKREEIQAQL